MGYIADMRKWTVWPIFKSRKPHFGHVITRGNALTLNKLDSAQHVLVCPSISMDDIKECV